MKTSKLMIALILGSALSISSAFKERELLTPQTFVVDTNSSTVAWKGEKIAGKSHNGTVQIQKGTLSLTNGILEAGEFVVDMTTIKNLDLDNETYNAKLVGHLKSDDFFGVDQYPTSSFTITKVEVIQKEGAVKGQAKYNVTGNFTVRSLTQEITFPITMIQNGNNLTVEGSFEFDRSKHNVKFGSGSFFDDLGDNLIKDMIKIDVKLMASAK